MFFYKIKSIEAKSAGRELFKMKMLFMKKMISQGPSQITTLAIETFMPSEIDYEKYKILR